MADATPPNASGSLRRIALVVAAATALSKLAGLVRQQAIAAAFGVGAAYDAFNYAYVLPGFLLILLGGINGPFHSAMVSVMARQERQQSARLLAAINTLVGSALLGATLEAGLLEAWLGPIAAIKPEVKYGLGGRSRIDLLLTPAATAPDQRPIYVEIKNTTWSRGSLALFPDTVTERGQKHLEELMGVLPAARAVLIPCLSRADVELFAPGDSADPRYGELFRQALGAGVEVFPCCFEFSATAVNFLGVVGVQNRESPIS